MSRAPQFAPASPRTLATLVLMGGVVLSIIGWADPLLLYIPPHFGEAEWEFGTISRTVDAMPLCALGIVLVVVGVRARGSSRAAARMLAALMVLIAIAIGALLVVFVFDVPEAFSSLNAQAERAGATAEQLLLTRAGMKQATVKVLLFGLLYIGLLVTLALTTWRNTGQDL